jgi:hypothetical protein
MLALAETEHPDELLADFQQYYGIDLWWQLYSGLEKLPRLDVAHMAALAYQLPPDSRVKRAVDPTGSNSTELQMLRRIEYNQRCYAWSKTKDAEHKRNEPQPVLLAGEREDVERREREQKQAAVDVAEAFNLSM